MVRVSDSGSICCSYSNEAILGKHEFTYAQIPGARHAMFRTKAAPALTGEKVSLMNKKPGNGS